MHVPNACEKCPKSRELLLSPGPKPENWLPNYSGLGHIFQCLLISIILVITDFYKEACLLHKMAAVSAETLEPIQLIRGLRDRSSFHIKDGQLKILPIKTPELILLITKSINRATCIFCSSISVCHTALTGSKHRICHCYTPVEAVKLSAADQRIPRHRGLLQWARRPQAARRRCHALTSWARAHASDPS